MDDISTYNLRTQHAVGEPPALGEVASRLARSALADRRIHHIGSACLPDPGAIGAVTDKLLSVLFPGFFGLRAATPDSLAAHCRAILGDAAEVLAEQIAAALRYDTHAQIGTPEYNRAAERCDQHAARIIDTWIRRLPRIQETLSLDVQAAFDGDPACRHTDEVVFCYPGLRALAVHRLAHELYLLDVPLVPRIMAERVHATTGIDIHPGARIGPSFFIDHGTGVVVGETTVIGEHCKVYQGVTLGAKSIPRDNNGRAVRGVKRHPTLEDHVTVYAGATILGGDTVIGAGCVIGGGVFLTHSTAPGRIILGPKPETSLRDNPDMPPASWTI